MTVCYSRRIAKMQLSIHNYTYVDTKLRDNISTPVRLLRQGAIRAP